MKKLFVLLLSSMLLLVSQSMYAQGIPLGVKGGPSYATVNTEFDSDVSGRIGFHFGVYSQFNITEDLLVQPEVLISLQGNESVNTSYLTLPVVAKYYILEPLSVHAGLQAGIMLGAEEEAEDLLKGFDLGIPIGAEFDLTEKLGVGVRYIIGFTSISELDRYDINEFNRVLQVFLAYDLPLGTN